MLRATCSFVAHGLSFQKKDRQNSLRFSEVRDSFWLRQFVHENVLQSSRFWFRFTRRCSDRMRISFSFFALEKSSFYRFRCILWSYIHVRFVYLRDGAVRQRLRPELRNCSLERIPILDRVRLSRWFSNTFEILTRRRFPRRLHTYIIMLFGVETRWVKTCLDIDERYLSKNRLGSDKDNIHQNYLRWVKIKLEFIWINFKIKFKICNVRAVVVLNFFFFFRTGRQMGSQIVLGKAKNVDIKI